MKALLDTHVLLWWLVDDARLSEKARRILSNAESEVYLSAASAWELAIKVTLGRIELPEPPRGLIPKVLRDQGFKALDITMAHALRVSELPLHHRDPFDRILVSQSLVERIPLLTADPMLAEYEARIVW